MRKNDKMTICKSIEDAENKVSTKGYNISFQTKSVFINNFFLKRLCKIPLILAKQKK